MKALLVAFLALAAVASAQDVVVHPVPVMPKPTDAPTFVGVYVWKQALWQYTVDALGTISMERGDITGGRVVAGIGFGRVGFALRLDISALKEQFSFQDPETFNTLELYGAMHVVAFTGEGFQFGPVVAGGSVTDKTSPPGIVLGVAGAGLRIGGHGMELHVLAGVHDYLPLGGWRASLSLHVPIIPAANMYAVGDIVSGTDGYARIGIAVRLK